MAESKALLTCLLPRSDQEMFVSPPGSPGYLEVGDSVWVDFSDTIHDDFGKSATPPWPGIVMEVQYNARSLFASKVKVCFHEEDGDHTLLIARCRKFVGLTVVSDETDVSLNDIQTCEPFGSFTDDIFCRNWRYKGSGWNTSSNPNVKAWQGDVLHFTTAYLKDRLGPDSEDVEVALRLKTFEKKMKALELLLLAHYMSPKLQNGHDADASLSASPSFPTPASTSVREQSSANKRPTTSPSPSSPRRKVKLSKTTSLTAVTTPSSLWSVKVLWEGYGNPVFDFSPNKVSSAINNADDGITVDVTVIYNRMAREFLPSHTCRHRQSQWLQRNNTREETEMAKQEGGNFVCVVEDLRKKYVLRLLDSRSHSGVKINPITREEVDRKVLRNLIDEDGDGEVGESEDSKRKKYNEALEVLELMFMNSYTPNLDLAHADLAHANLAQADLAQGLKRCEANLGGKTQLPMVSGGTTTIDDVTIEDVIKLASTPQYVDRESKAWFGFAAMQACNCVLQYTIVMGMLAPEFLVKREKYGTLFTSTGTPLTSPDLKLLYYCTVEVTPSLFKVTFQQDDIVCEGQTKRFGVKASQAANFSAGIQEEGRGSCWIDTLKGVEAVSGMDFLERCRRAMVMKHGEDKAKTILDELEDPVAISVSSRYGPGGNFVLLVRVGEGKVATDWLISTSGNQVVRTRQFNAEQIRDVARNAIFSGLGSLVVNENKEAWHGDGQAAFNNLIGFLHIVSVVHVALGPLLRRGDSSETTETTIIDSAVALCRIGLAHNMSFCEIFSLCEWTQPNYTRFIIAMLLPYPIHVFSRYGFRWAKKGAVKGLLNPGSDIKRLLSAVSKGCPQDSKQRKRNLRCLRLTRVAVVLIYEIDFHDVDDGTLPPLPPLPQITDGLKDMSTTSIMREYLNPIAMRLSPSSDSPAAKLGLCQNNGGINQKRLLELLIQYNIELTSDIFKKLYRFEIFSKSLAWNFLTHDIANISYCPFEDVRNLLEKWGDDDYGVEFGKLSEIIADKGKERAEKQKSKKRSQEVS
ncbi:hypothetical protein TrCOL_g3701 [Triparma columacea]|uniref:Uncharacterized protein n=1 Tax=Triparma columacea TaxID=722753 RepID=A0A9W7GEL5_9STRA|nr:hypothetical protein TrCOL_g3701 [Triparma columacea]